MTHWYERMHVTLRRRGDTIIIVTRRFSTLAHRLRMRLSFNSVNMCTKLVSIYTAYMFTRNMAANNKTQMVPSHYCDIRLIVSNGQ